MISRQRYPFLFAIGIGLFFALVSRYLFDDRLADRAGNLLTFSYIFGVPLALGAITAHFVPAEREGWRLAGAPILVVFLFLISTLIFSLEGLVCLIIIGPAFVILAVAGSGTYILLTRKRQASRDKALAVAAFTLLPFLAVMIENHVNTPDNFRRVENSVLIDAPAPVVWQHIIRVAPIRATDLRPSLIDDIGFPRPVEATLTHEGVGGVRHATFERGVEFIETVDDWQPLQRLSFSIEPNTATIPPTTFDEHVIVGGRFFDVLRGTYELRPAGAGHTQLVLYSEQRLSTHLNWYAGFWTGYVMSEIQHRILLVLKRRCEAQVSVAVAATAPEASRAR